MDVLKGANVFLIGMMGAGKTTIGRILADQLGYAFFDTDKFIEQATGQAISAIFAESGEAIFRQLETATLSQVSARTRKVIATGGGIVVAPENWIYLKHGVIVWLDVSIDQLQQRLKQDTTRPLLPNLQQLQHDRAALYAQADIRIVPEPRETPSQIAARIVDAIMAECEKKRQIDAAIQRLNEDLPFQML